MEENSVVRKKRTVTVNTPMGPRKVVLAYADQNNLEANINWCESFCKYSKMCPHLPHPEDPTNENLSFTDWCGDLQESDEEMKAFVPWEGVEDLYEKGSEGFQIMNAIDKLVPLSVIREVVCKDMCLYYTEDGSKCAEKDNGCIIHSLLKKRNDKFPIKEQNPDGTPVDNRALSIEEMEEAVKKSNEEDKEF